MAYLKNQIDIFKKSFKVNKKDLLTVAAYDFLLILVSYIILFFWGEFIKTIFSKIGEFDLTKFTEATIEQISHLKNFYYGTIISLLILMVLLFITWSFFKGLIWNKILNKHFTFKYFKKFLLLNLACIPILLLVISLVLLISLPYSTLILSLNSILNKSIASFIIFIVTYLIFIPIIVYFMFPLSVTYMYFTKNNNIKKSLKKTFKIVIKKIHLLYFPCLMMSFMLFLISIVTTPLNSLSGPVLPLVSIILLILSVIYTAWARFYIVDVIAKLERTHRKI